MGGIMKKAFLVMIVLASVLLLADEKSDVVVNNTSVVTGVIVVDVQFKGKTAELQCNEGSPDCNKLKPGNYIMVQLPKNHGLYDCANVEVYSPTATETDQRVGAYCLIPK
jgi:hypothetical protein